MKVVPADIPELSDSDSDMEEVPTSHANVLQEARRKEEEDLKATLSVINFVISLPLSLGLVHSCGHLIPHLQVNANLSRLINTIN